MNRSNLARVSFDGVAEDAPLPPEDRVAVLRRIGLDTLFREQRPRLLRLFSRRAGPSEADDLVQEAFARYAGRRDAGGDAIATPEAYLSRVAINLLRDRARLAVTRAATHHELYDDNAVVGPDPALRLEARDALRRVEAAVARLKPRTRTVFLLQRTEGLTYPQIAERTGMSVTAVKKQMAKALLALRRDLGAL